MTQYIFIIANSFQARVAEAYVDKNSIDPSSIVLVTLRPVRWEVGQHHVHRHWGGRLTRVLWRIFGFSINAFILNIRLRLRSKNYFLVAPWHNEYVDFLVSKPMCLGVYYCEEGDLSYWTEDVMFNGRDRNSSYNLERRRGPAKRWLFDQNCAGFICTSENCFPMVDASLKKFVKIGARGYQNVSKEGDIIAVLPTAARLSKICMIEVLRTYRDASPRGHVDYVKMHPSFDVHPRVKAEFGKAMALPEFSGVRMMDESVDLELEILANPLILIGLESSVERFALQNGSTYLKVFSLLKLQANR